MGRRNSNPRIGCCVMKLSCSMQLTQCLGREFAKQELVVLGKASEVPHSKLSRNLGDIGYGRISGFERTPNLMECSELKIANRSYAEVVLESRAQCSLRDACGSSEVFHDQVLVGLLVDEIHRLADDLPARDLMSAGRSRHVQLAP